MFLYVTCLFSADSSISSFLQVGILVFSKCFRAEFGAFSTFKFKVIEAQINVIYVSK